MRALGCRRPTSPVTCPIALFSRFLRNPGSIFAVHRVPAGGVCMIVPSCWMVTRLSAGGTALPPDKRIVPLRWYREPLASFAQSTVSFLCSMSDGRVTLTTAQAPKPRNPRATGG